MMKRIFCLTFAILLYCTSSFAAGSCEITKGYSSTGDGKRIEQTLLFTCTGDASDGSIPDTAISASDYAYVQGWRLMSVSAYPTSGGTAPDAADVFVIMAGEDLLGSSDAGTTSDGNGTNLIHASVRKTTSPIYNNALAGFYPRVTSTLTLKVTNQATVEADFSVLLKFENI